MTAERTLGDRRLELRPGQQLIAEMPAGPGVYLGVIWSTYNPNCPALLFQRWRYGADGERITVTGLTVVPAECLPAFASAIADAMELAEHNPPAHSG